ncbi:MAG: DUF948 domain-containing protein, partial [Candidatus Paceibacterota bacterium]
MKKRQQNLSFQVTRWIGSAQSVVIHTIFFVAIFSLRFFGFSTDDILLILTTLVSLEAIYLAIFIQMTINQHSEDLEEVSEDIGEIQEDVDEIQKDVGELQEDVEEISEDVEDIQKDVEEISEDVEEISEDVEDISEDVEGIQKDVEEMNEDEEATELSRFEYMEHTLQALLKEIQESKQKSVTHQHHEQKETKR